MLTGLTSTFDQPGSAREAQVLIKEYVLALQVDLERLVGEVSLGSSSRMGPGIGSGSPGTFGHGSMTSMGSAPTPRNMMSANAFVSAQGLQNRNLSDLGSYLELLSSSTGQEQVLITRL